MSLEYDLFMKVTHGSLDIVLSNISNPSNALGVKIWNSIPTSIKVLSSRINYRKVMKCSLEDFLQSEDDYVEVPRLIELFSSLSLLPNC